MRLAATALLVLCAAVAGCDPTAGVPTDSLPDDTAVEAGVAAADVEAADEPRPATVLLRVDHAWVKDGSTPTEQEQRRTTMDALRAKVTAGEAFEAAWASLELSGEHWHVAEGETYPADALPAGARDLPIGQVSGVIPGDGGLHLFRILGREDPS